MKPFKILKTEILVNEPFAKMERETIELPDGSTKYWYTNRGASDIVRVFPVLDTGEIMMLKMYRHGVQGEVYEFPAGMVDWEEAPERSVERELLEETGYKPQQIEKLGSVYFDTNRNGAKAHFYIAKECAKVQNPQKTPDEQIETVILPDMEAVEEILRTQPVSKGEWAILGYVQSYLKYNTL